MIKQIEVYDDEVVLRDESGNIIERYGVDNPVIEDRRGLPFWSGK